MILLSMLTGPARGQTVKLDVDSVTIGRAPDNILQINHASISKHHAVLRSQGNGFEVVDVGSTNGVYVNGQQTPSSGLKHGDRIQLGDIMMRFELSTGQTESIQTPASTEVPEPAPVEPPPVEDISVSAPEPASVVEEKAVEVPAPSTPATPTPSAPSPKSKENRRSRLHAATPLLHLVVAGIGGGLLWLGYLQTVNALRFFGLVFAVTGVVCLVMWLILPRNSGKTTV